MRLSRGKTFSKQALGSPSLLFNSYRGILSHDVKRHGTEGDQSPPHSADAKNERSFTAPSPYAFMAWLGEIFDFITFSRPTTGPTVVHWKHVMS